MESSRYYVRIMNIKVDVCMGMIANMLMVEKSLNAYLTSPAKR